MATLIPRDADAIRSELRKLLPRWLSQPDDVAEALLQAIAAGFETVEGAQALLWLRTFILNADGSWLDEHGSERGVYRLAGETDDAYRQRVRGVEDKVSPPAIVAGVNTVLLTGVATLEEHRLDGAFACELGSGFPQAFADVSYAYDGLRIFTVYIQHQAPASNDTAFAAAGGSGLEPQSFAVDSNGAGAWPNDAGSFADQESATASETYARVWSEIDRLRAAGVSFRVVVQG